MHQRKGRTHVDLHALQFPAHSRGHREAWVCGVVINEPNKRLYENETDIGVSSQK